MNNSKKINASENLDRLTILELNKRVTKWNSVKEILPPNLHQVRIAVEQEYDDGDMRVGLWVGCMDGGSWYGMDIEGSAKFEAIEIECRVVAWADDVDDVIDVDVSGINFFRNEHLLNCSLNKLGLTSRAVEALAPINIIGDLVTRSRVEILTYPELGVKIANEIESALANQGLSLRQ